MLKAGDHVKRVKDWTGSLFVKGNTYKVIRINKKEMEITCEGTECVSLSKNGRGFKKVTLNEWKGKK